MVRMIRALLCRILNRIGTVFIRKDALRLSLQIAILRPLNETNERTNTTICQFILFDIVKMAVPWFLSTPSAACGAGS